MTVPMTDEHRSLKENCDSLHQRAALLREQLLAERPVAPLGLALLETLVATLWLLDEAVAAAPARRRRAVARRPPIERRRGLAQRYCR